MIITLFRCKNPNTEESFLSGSFSKEAVGSPFKRTSLYGTTFQKFLSELEAEQKKKSEMQEKQEKQKKNQESSIHTMAELIESETKKSSQGNSQPEKKNMWLGIAASVLILGIIILAILLNQLIEEDKKPDISNVKKGILSVRNTLDKVKSILEEYFS